MNRYPIIIIIFVLSVLKSGYSQSRLREPGIYEVGDTTIEVYNWKDPYAVREFKIINGTETILYKSYNRLTKKLQEEGTFKGGYSSGTWKFYGWTGRLKNEINYDNMVKTCYEKKVELNPEELFDFVKFKEDSILAQKYRKQKILAAKKNVIHDTIYIEKPAGLTKSNTADKKVQATAIKAGEPVKTASDPQPAQVKKETAATAVAQPTVVKKDEPAKAVSAPSQPAPVKKETAATAVAQPTVVKKDEPAKTVSAPSQSAPVKKEIPAATAVQPTEIKKSEAVKSQAPTKPAPVKKEIPEQHTTKVSEDKKAVQGTPTPVKQKDAALIDQSQQETEQPEAGEKQITVTANNGTVEPQPEPVTNHTSISLPEQPEDRQTEIIEEKKIAVIAAQKNETQVTALDSTQQKPVGTMTEKAEAKRKLVNQNLYYGWRSNGNWFEISNLKSNEFVMRYNTRTEEKTRFSFFEFALDSIGKLKREKIITRVSDLKKQSLLKLQLLDSLALVYGMQAMDKPFSYLLEYTVDSTQASHAKFELYITGMPYNKKVEENKITEPFDFIVLDPWTGELITKGNGNAITDNDEELSIRMTTLVKYQDVQ